MPKIGALSAAYDKREGTCSHAVATWRPDRLAAADVKRPPPSCLSCESHTLNDMSKALTALIASHCQK